MPAANLCLRCMMGSYSGGKCSHCGKPQPLTVELDPTALPSGYQLRGRYYMGLPLGHGGFGITYAAWDSKTNQRVAVKELFPASSVTRGGNRITAEVIPGRENDLGKMKNAFRQEAKTLMLLQGQEGIINLYHAFEANDTVYYVMEYLEGTDLAHRLKKNGIMRWETLAPIVRTLLRALDQIHSAGLIHRDISPDNIYLTSDGHTRLIDFGSARAYQGNDHFTTIIKYNFAPWEQFLSEGKQGPWTDIYAFCVTIYYALSGKLPPMASEQKLNGAAVIPLKNMGLNIPAHVCKAVECGMAFRVEDRYKSVAELYSGLFPGEPSLVSPTREPAGIDAERQPVHTDIPKPVPEKPFHAVEGRRILGRNGVFRGKQWDIRPGMTFRIGRNPALELSYPNGVRGVSRQQCTIRMDEEGRVLVRDDGSSYGTFLVTRTQRVKLIPNQWYHAGSSVICFGEQEQFLIQ